MFFILILIVAVAAFNLVSSLVMIVTVNGRKLLFYVLWAQRHELIILFLWCKVYGRVGRYIVVLIGELRWP